MGLKIQVAEVVRLRTRGHNASEFSRIQLQNPKPGGLRTRLRTAFEDATPTKYPAGVAVCILMTQVTDRSRHNRGRVRQGDIVARCHFDGDPAFPFGGLGGGLNAQSL